VPGRSYFSVVTWIVLFAFWVTVSGRLDWFHLLVGVATVACVAWLQSRLRPLRNPGDPRLRFVPLLLYIPWLLWQMVVSAVLVARLILWERDRVDPQLFAFRSRQPSVVNHVVFANSITLTPGTITVDLKDDRYLVHALCPETARGVLGGSMARKVAGLNVKGPDAQPERIPVESFENG
jgi:multicomponent Na+:H+ antiporter subunit E